MLSNAGSAAVNGVDAYSVEGKINAGYGDTLIVLIATDTPQKVMKIPEISVP
jgi:hypothetical protein